MTTIYAQGDKVTYMGHPAAVTTGNAPLPGWTTEPDRCIGIRFDRNVPGHSRQFDIEAAAVLRAS